MNSLQDKMSKRFLTFGSISLIFGICFTACFYRAGIGLSYPLFVLIAIVLLQIASSELSGLEKSPAEVTDKAVFHFKAAYKKPNSAWLYYAGAFLLALSTIFTANYFFLTFNTIGILILLELSLLHQFVEESLWDVSTYFFRMIVMLFASLFHTVTILFDGMDFLRTHKKAKSEKFMQVLLGILIAIPLLIVVTLLLASSDKVFLNITEQFTNVFFLSANPFYLFLFLVVSTCICYGILQTVCYLRDEVVNKKPIASDKTVFVDSDSAAANISSVSGNDSAVVINKTADVTNNSTDDTAAIKDQRRPFTAITVVLCLTAIYLLYSFIQIFTLFAVNEALLPAGVTYSDYAREGFFELLAVTILNFIIVMICSKSADHSKFLRILLLVMSACTYIMIISAAFRMILYVSAYDLSFLRVLVLWFLVVNSGLMAGAILRVLKPNFPLFHYCTIVVASLYILFAFSRPDSYIAAYNISNADSLNTRDVAYLTSLSADAVPSLLPLYQQYQEEFKDMDPFAVDSNNSDSTTYYALLQYAEDIQEQGKNKDIRSLNVSIYKAAKLLDELNLPKLNVHVME